MNDKKFNVKSTPSSERSTLHLVDNKHNSVEVIRCDNEESVKIALKDLEKYPHVCIAGVSNAGKSSMINHLVRKRNLAKASSVPGKTRSVDLFIINDKFVLADFPGMPSTDPQLDGQWRAKWRPLVKEYMANVVDLRAFIYIHDVRWPIAPDEVKFNKWMRRSFDIPSFLLVLSKDDKVGHNQRLMGLNNARNKLGFTDKDRHLHYCSDNSIASCRNGRRHVLRYIENALALENRQGKSTPNPGDLEDPI
mmetsp:Transcript_3141/g.4704  ORF Transcript_3141/g.4704 Transcript_3141/m.4704 type:complete len:250 (-) Transcript_3141:89-838(-)